MKSICRCLAVASLLGLFVFASSAAAGTTEQARGILRNHQDAVVSVKLVIKSAMAFGGRNGTKNESKTEATGTVIKPTGLTVLSLSATDPGGLMQKIFKGQSGGGDAEMKWESELGDVKILHPNGRELPARVLLRDADLDLVFVEPTEKPEEPFAFVDLAQAAMPDILDEVLVVNRLGTVASRAPAAVLGRIAARVEKPRTFFALDESSAPALGVPVFTLADQVVGIILLRSVDTGGGFGFEAMLSGANNLGLLPIIVPASDILESAEQINEQAKEQKQPAAPETTEEEAVADEKENAE